MTKEKINSVIIFVIIISESRDIGISREIFNITPLSILYKFDASGERR